MTSNKEREPLTIAAAKAQATSIKRAEYRVTLVEGTASQEAQPARHWVEFVGAA